MSFDSLSPSHRKAVREELDRLLESEQFQQARRRQRFLEYIVTETLDGRGDRLKGYTIAREVFDRPEEFDPNTDPIVRMEAARLRDRLREYYEGDGRDDPVRIELPKGTYTPQIAFAPVVDRPPKDRNRAVAEVTNREPLQLRSWGQWRIVASVAALVTLLAAAAVWFAASELRPPEKLLEGEPSLSDVPAVAVLPFINLSGDPKQDYFSDGITEDILTELSRARDLRVLARNTTFQYKGKAVNVRELGRELAVRYVLEGSIRRSDDRLRVTAQLIDTKTGTHIWADRYDRDMADVSFVQDEIVSQIAAKIAGSYGAIELNEAKASSRKSADQIQAYDLVLRAREIMQWDWTSDNFRAAREALSRAISLDPSNAQARRELAWLAVIGWIFELDETPVPPEEIKTQAAKAVGLDPFDARARMVAASAYFFTKQLEHFAREANRALTLAPFDAEIMATLACMISAAGDRERGVALAEKANVLNADAAIGWYHSTVYTADYLKGDYQHALEVARQNQDAEIFYSYLEIIPIFGQLGLKREALDAWKKLQVQLPDVSAKTFEDWWRLWNLPEADIAKLMDGVRKSGVLVAEG